MPFVGGFGVDVTHDVLQTAGIILLIGLNIRRILYTQPIPFDKYKLIDLIAIILLCTTVSGLIISVIYSLSFARKQKYKISLCLLFFTVAFHQVSSLGITKDTSNFGLNSLVGDLKCIAQQPMARISPDEWRFLETLAPVSEWKNPVTCSTADAGWHALSHLDYKKVTLDKTFIKNYLKIVAGNPAVYAEAHLQRSRGVLPPPFFDGPENQVVRDLSIPVGLNTNVALQTGPEVIHPSVDEPSVQMKLKVLKPFEFLAQMSIFTINQASWFWGWGGLWSWFIFIVIALYFRKNAIKAGMEIFYPLVALDAILILVSPGGYPRYVMSSEILGFAMMVALITAWRTGEASELKLLSLKQKI
jgi:hypothetical protein